MSQPSEILVHISAPSRFSDDTKYRQQLRSLLSFEPVRRRVITAPDTAYSKGCSGEEGPEHDALFQRSLTYPISEAGEEEGALTTLIPNSNSSNAPTSSSSHHSNQTTTSCIPETTLKSTSNVDIIRTPFPTFRTNLTTNAPSTGICETPIHPNTNTSSWATPPSVIPDSQPTPANKKRALDATSSSPSPKRRLTSSSPSPTRISSPTAKRPRTLPPSKILSNNQPLLPTSRPTAVQQAQAQAQAAVRSSSPLPPLTSPPLPPTSSPSVFRPAQLTIHPPRPPISTQKFKTHLTPDLAALAAKQQLRGYYTSQIRLQTRNLEIHERGHWMVPIGRLSEEEKGVLWEFLGRFVGKGKAGWGVWCLLEGVGSSEQEQERVEGVPGMRGEGLEVLDEEEEEEEEEEPVLKVYCWGEMVGEVWNVLFLGTGKKVKGCGARWVGMREGEGEGMVEEEVVVWMK